LSIAALLAFTGAVVSGLLLFDHHGVGSARAAVNQLCGASEESGCEQVSQSRYSSIGNYSVAALGVFFYGSMLLLAAIGLASTSDTVRDSAAGLALAGFGAALAVDIVLFALQAVAIGAYCRLCLATYAVNAVALFVLFPLRSRIRSVLAGSEARRALSVWAVGAVVVAVGVGAVDRALAGVRPEAPLLGESEYAPPSDVAPEPPPAVSETPVVAAPPPGDSDVAKVQAQLQAAQARIGELQATLDDPQKFQAYQEQKAAENFERQERVDLDLAGVPVKGPADAPIKVAEFSDFLCPFCRNLAGAFSGFLPQSQGRVSVFFKHYPLDQACNPVMTRTVHDGACELALGGICAEEQGKFWPYHDRVFGQPPVNPTNDDVVRIATEAGLDGNALRQCLSSPAARAKLDRDIAEGKRLEVNATPTVFVNGKRLEQIGAFMKAIESESKRLGLPAASP
jgi:serine/threonine-protein kinase